MLDVAGPSSAVDEVFGQLSGLLAELRTADGAPILGEPVSQQDYSEISAKLDLDFGQLVSQPMLDAAEGLSAAGRSGGYPNSITFQVGEPSHEIGSVAPNLTIQTRAGTRPDERIFFSALWTRSDDNVAWLEDLEGRFR